MLFKLISAFSITIFIFYLQQWQSPSINQNPQTGVHQCIYHSKKHKSIRIQSFNRSFDVNCIKNSDVKCINPYFPSIHITTNSKNNAWLHIVYTDSKHEKLRCFVDASSESEVQKIFPLYTLGSNFYDSPLWTYSLFYKPLSFWIGHAWAVDINFKRKTIKPIGGVSWGFNLLHLCLRPKMVEPLALDRDMWNHDWKIFKEKLVDFKIVD